MALSIFGLHSMRLRYCLSTTQYMLAAACCFRKYLETGSVATKSPICSVRLIYTKSALEKPFLRHRNRSRKTFLAKEIAKDQSVTTIRKNLGRIFTPLYSLSMERIC